MCFLITERKSGNALRLDNYVRHEKSVMVLNFEMQKKQKDRNRNVLLFSMFVWHDDGGGTCWHLRGGCCTHQDVVDVIKIFYMTWIIHHILLFPYRYHRHVLISNLRTNAQLGTKKICLVEKVPDVIRWIKWCQGSKAPSYPNCWPNNKAITFNGSLPSPPLMLQVVIT